MPFFPIVTAARQQRAAQGHAACKRRYNCTKQRILADREVQSRQDAQKRSLAVSLNVRLNTAFRK